LQFIGLLSKYSSLSSLIFILSLSTELLSLTCSSLLEWLSTVLFVLRNFSFSEFLLIFFF
jgi:hypothetical protein